MAELKGIEEEHLDDRTCELGHSVEAARRTQATSWKKATPLAKEGDDVSPRLRDFRAAVERGTRQATWARRFFPSGQACIWNQERCRGHRFLGDPAVRT